MTTPTSRAVILEPGEGERITVGASTLSIKAETATTGGTVFMSETELEAGFPGPPPHVHDRLHDMFYVLEGVLTFLVDGETIDARPGTFVCVPPGTVHTFTNRSDGPVRFLNLNTPAGFEATCASWARRSRAAGRRRRPRRWARSPRATTSAPRRRRRPEGRPRSR